MNLILFLAGVFLFTFLLGRELEKIRIPWIFSALLIGLGLAVYNPFQDATSSSSFIFLANLGMYLLLFIIGFELDIHNIINQKKFIIKATTLIILTETFFGSLLVHYVFNVTWLISVLVASSFATVGEAVLLPILDEFNLIKTKLGQTILSIGVLDDVVEVATIILASIVVGRKAGHSEHSIIITLSIIAFLFAVAFIAPKFSKKVHSFRFKDIPSFFLFLIFIIFLFIGFGMYAESAALGEILVGIALMNIVP